PEIRCEGPLDRPRGALVQGAAAISEERRVSGVLGERVLEDVLRARSRVLLVEEVGRLEDGELAAQLGLGLPADLASEVAADGPSDYRQHLQERLGGMIVAVEAARGH